MKLKSYKILSEGKGYRITRLQERKDYKSLSKREMAIFFLGIGTLNLRTRTLENLDLELKPRFLNLSSVFGVYPFIDEMNHGKSSKVT